MRILKLPVVVGALLVVGAAQGQIIREDANYSINHFIPDNDPTGLASTRTFNSSIVALSNIAVTLSISGNWNGDLYGYIVHDGGFSVLLNRVGRTTNSPAAPYGYTDNGFNVTIDDLNGTADIHTCRVTLGSSFLSSALTGTWLSDARSVDPDLADTTTARTATLASFTGLNPNGDWTLFLADLSAGNESTLVSWGLQAYGVVPEPGTGLLFLGGLSVVAWLARRRKN